MASKELIARSQPLLCNLEVRAMYDTYRRMLVQVLQAQGFSMQAAQSSQAEVLGCKDGAELLGWDMFLDTHTGQTLLVSLTLGVCLAGIPAGRCSLVVRLCYVNNDVAEAVYTVLNFPPVPDFEASEEALGQLAQQLLERTTQDESWLGWETSDFADWLEQETTN